MAPRSTKDIDIDLIRRILVDQWLTIALFMVIGIGAVGLGTSYSVKWYTAKAVIQLLPQAGKEIEVDEVRKLNEGGYMEGRDRARTQLQIIQSRIVRQEVVRRYREQGYRDLTNDDEGAGQLKRWLSASPREDTQLVEIAVEHTDPEAAALLANLTAQVYYETNLEFRRNAAKSTQEWIDGQEGAYEVQLQDATNAVLQFNEEHGLVDIKGSVDETSTRLISLQRALADTNTKRVLLGGELAEHERLLSQGRTDVLAGMFNDVALRAISQKYAEMQAEAAEARGRYGDKHPEVRQATANLEEVRQLLGVEVMRLIKAERTDYQALRRQEQRLTDEVNDVKQLLLNRQKLVKQYERLAQAETEARTLVTSLEARGAEVDLQAQTQLSDVRIVDLAVPPTNPSKPNFGLNIAMAFIVSLTGGLALAVVRYQDKDSLLTVEDVERRTGLTVIGAVPLLPPEIPEATRPLYSMDHPHSLPAEAYRSLRTMLKVRSGNGRRQVVLVTSGVAGEGKTTVSVGLCSSFARLGGRALLIDADVRRPRVHQIFGGKAGPGLTDVLSRRVDPLSLVRKTPQADLFYLPAGRETEHGAELLYSPTFKDMLERVAEAFDIVVIDTSPVGLVADALAFSKHVDGAVVVVRRDLAPARLSQAAVAQLEGVGTRVYGAVFNGVPPSRDARVYGKGYYTENPAKKRLQHP